MFILNHFLNPKPSFIYHVGRRTYKIFTPKGKTFKTAELAGNRHALQSEFWKSQVLEVTPYLFCLEMKRGKPVRSDKLGEAEQFVELKLQEAANYPREQANLAYDFIYLKELERYGLHAGLLKSAEEMLKSAYLPVTSAHGDLHVGNMIFIGKHLHIIDWSMFSGKGSYVTDYIHFFNYRQASIKAESWTSSILEDQPYLDSLALRFETTAQHLRIAYALSRISGATAQRENMGDIPHEEILKYNAVLNHIIHVSDKAPI